MKRLINTIKWITSKNRIKLTKYISFLKRYSDLLHHKKNPCYLIIGANHSGKTTLVEKSGLKFNIQDNFMSKHKNMNNCPKKVNSWTADNCSFIEISDDEDSLMLKSIGKKMSVKGIIIAYSITDLLPNSESKRDASNNYLSGCLKRVSTAFKHPIPTYLIITKCDQIPGFIEYFEKLSHEESTQVFGVTFSNNIIAPEYISDIIETEFEALLTRLNRRKSYHISLEKNRDSRIDIFNFIHELRIIKNTIIDLISELFEDIFITDNYKIQGVYFTSASWSSDTSSCIDENITEINNTKIRSNKKGFSKKETFFISQLFDKLIENSNHPNFEYLRSLKRRKYKYFAAILASITLVSSTLIMIDRAYKEFQSNTATLNYSIASYRSIISKNKNIKFSIINYIPAFDILQSSYNKTVERSMISKLFLSYFVTKYSIFDAFKRSLYLFYIPWVAMSIEKHMVNYRHLDIEPLYNYLNAYLVLDLDNRSEKSISKKIMHRLWPHLLQGKTSIDTKLIHYMDILTEDHLHVLILNKSLIDNIKSKLRKIKPELRAYNLLSMASKFHNLPNINLNALLGINFTDIFDLEAGYAVISKLYTSDGYKMIFKKNNNQIVSKILQDNDQIKINADSKNEFSKTYILKELDSEYKKQYRQQWTRTLSNIKIKHFKDLNHTLFTLNNLISDDSVLTRLLIIIKNNTNLISSESIYLNDINSYDISTDKNNNYNILLDDLRTLHKVLSDISRNEDKNLACYQTLKRYMNNPDENIFKKLSNDSKSAPKLLRNWIDNLNTNIRSTVINNAIDYINRAWRITVMKEYNKSIKNFYPFNTRTKRQVDIDSFDHFFKENGTLDSFYKDYLSPFVRSNLKYTSNNVKNDFNINISKKIIAIFQNRNRIKQNYFRGNGSKIGFVFTINPLVLDKRAKSAQIKLGSKIIKYSHGPRIPIHIHWPFSKKSENCRIIVENFRGKQFSKNEHGTWCIFQLLMHSNDRSFLNINSNEYTAYINNLAFTFNIKNDDRSLSSKYKKLQEFSLPDSLIDGRPL